MHFIYIYKIYDKLYINFIRKVTFLTGKEHFDRSTLDFKL